MGARLILVQGPSGEGKSRSWLNMDATKTFVISPNGKPFPFRGAKKKYTTWNSTTGVGNVIITNELNDLAGALEYINSAPHIKYILLDDFSHYFSTRVMSPDFIAQNSGNAAFAKWNVFGSDVQNAIFSVAQNLRDDLTIVINHHTDMGDDGVFRFRTSGNLLKKVIDPVSYFTYVFHTYVTRDAGVTKYQFITNVDGQHEAKSPEGCFDSLYIPNDIKLVIDTIENYENGDEE